jgi:hypothetical protein
MFKRNVHRTPRQKAERAQMNVFARLAGCGFLVYYVVKLIQTPKEETPGTAIATIVLIVLFVLGTAIIAITLLDFIRGIKSGHYKASTYEEEDLAEYLENRDADTTPDTNKDEEKENEDS